MKVTLFKISNFPNRVQIPDLGSILSRRNKKEEERKESDSWVKQTRYRQNFALTHLYISSL